MAWRALSISPYETGGEGLVVVLAWKIEEAEAALIEHHADVPAG